MRENSQENKVTEMNEIAEVAYGEKVLLGTVTNIHQGRFNLFLLLQGYGLIRQVAGEHAKIQLELDKKGLNGDVYLVPEAAIPVTQQIINYVQAVLCVYNRDELVTFTPESDCNFEWVMSFNQQVKPTTAEKIVKKVQELNSCGCFVVVGTNLMYVAKKGESDLASLLLNIDDICETRAGRYGVTWRKLRQLTMGSIGQENINKELLDTVKRINELVVGKDGIYGVGLNGPVLCLFTTRGITVDEIASVQRIIALAADDRLSAAAGTIGNYYTDKLLTGAEVTGEIRQRILNKMKIITVSQLYTLIELTTADNEVLTISRYSSGTVGLHSDTTGTTCIMDKISKTVDENGAYSGNVTIQDFHKLAQILYLKDETLKDSIEFIADIIFNVDSQSLLPCFDKINGSTSRGSKLPVAFTIKGSNATGKEVDVVITSNANATTFSMAINGKNETFYGAMNEHYDMNLLNSEIVDMTKGIVDIVTFAEVTAGFTMSSIEWQDNKYNIIVSTGEMVEVVEATTEEDLK